MSRSTGNNSKCDVSTKTDHSSPLLPRQRSAQLLATRFGWPLLIIAMLSIWSLNNNSPFQIFLAFMLLLIPWVSLQKWKKEQSVALPIFALIAGFHWLYFAVALFLGNRVAPVWYSSTQLVSEDSITKVLLMVLLGISTLGFGMRLPWMRIMPRLPPVTFHLSTGRWHYIRALLILGALLSLFSNLATVFGEGGRQFIYAVQDTVPLVATLILLNRYFDGYANHLDKALLFGYIVVRLIVGLGSGWSGSILYFGVALGLMYFLKTRRIPVRIMIVFLLFTLFIQPNKGDFRANFWYGDREQTDVITRVSYWLEASANSWLEAFNDPTREKLNSHLSYIVLRTSLLTHAANVHDKTPEIVPYQGVGLYRFAVAGLMPRFLWPEKPSANDANRFFQVAYDVTPVDRLGDVSIAIGFLTESYISLGWIGVIVIMLLVGGIYAFIQRAFFSDLTDSILPAIGIVVIIRLLDIESQFGRYFVGIIQTVIYSYIFLLPLTLRIRSLPSLGESQNGNAI